MKNFSCLLALLILSLPFTSAASERKPRGEKALKAPVTLASEDHSVKLVYLTTQQVREPLRPFFDPLPKGLGSQGAMLGVDDNNTTGQFTRQSFRLQTVVVEDPSSLETQFKTLLSEKNRLFLFDLSAENVLKLSRLPEASDSILMDISNGNDQLRANDCQENLFFLMPSDAMRSDALAQYFGKKRWQKWFLVTGKAEEDQRLAEAIRHSARKFGAKITKEAVWAYTFDDRRSPESEVPVFTQQADDYDILLVADADKLFADFFPYRTWQPKLVAGSTGLVAGAWHNAHEAWGALQLQNRFRDKFGRPMIEKDYVGWLASRTIGEAATRSHSENPSDIKRLLLDPTFSVAGFKGVPLSFRPWDHQMRQPILLGAERTVVAVAPIEGYLHPENTLDTLGSDAPESSCSIARRQTPPSP